jgi:hypothetical protein
MLFCRVSASLSLLNRFRAAVFLKPAAGSGQFLIRLHGKAEIVGALDGYFLVYFGDRTAFVVPTFGPHSVIQAYE